MERMIPRETFVKKEKTSANYIHEVIFAIRQRNLESLEELVIARSTPGNTMYQKWLTFEELGAMTSNEPGAKAVETWLLDQNITVSWKSAHSDYLKASASVNQWDDLLVANFYNWEDSSAGDLITNHILTEEYSLPDFLIPHLTAVFNTCQTPPVISKHYVRLPPDSKSHKTTLVVKDAESNLRKVGDRKLASSCASSTGVVTVSFLDCFYEIGSNIGTYSRLGNCSTTV